MDKAEQIRERIKQLANGVGPVPTLLGQVISVDKEELTCVLDDGDLEVYDVRLSPVITGKKSMVLFPVVGSWVLAARIEDEEEWYVIGTDEVEDIELQAKESITISTAPAVLKIEDGKFEIKNNIESLGGLLDDLITEILAIYAPKNVANILLLQERFKTLLNGT